MSGLLGYYDGLLTLINDRIHGRQPGPDSTHAQTDDAAATETSPDESDLARIIAASAEQVADNASPEELRAMRLDVCAQALAEVSHMLKQPA
ncbi:MAG TPA: hypothetical protein VFH57_01695 [Gammaproteobacteria bacterium]|nr:hypothetical protein [Gammaproteobacteria bacterium]